MYFCDIKHTSYTVNTTMTSKIQVCKYHFTNLCEFYNYFKFYEIPSMDGVFTQE